MAGLIQVASGPLFSLNDKPAAAAFLAAYDMRIQFRVRDGEPFYAAIRGGRVRTVAEGLLEDLSIRDDIELSGDEGGFRLVFEGRLSPATAMYHGLITPRGERSKHCQAALTLTLLRMAQELAPQPPPLPT
jgi:hypothetical protein